MIDQSETRTHPLVPLAIAFELSLAVLGWLIAWVAGVRLRPLLWPEPNVAQAVGYGVLATLPLLPLLAGMLFCRWRPIALLRRLVIQFVEQAFGRASLWRLACLSLAAGFGEEILFRGAIQPIVVSHTSPLVGIVLVSMLFGVVHAVSWSYFWLAALIGAYFGILAHGQGEILSASIAHAAYDFIALVCLARGCYVGRRPLFAVHSR